MGESLSHFNDYIEPMMTFTALAKIYSTKYFCRYIAGLGQNVYPVKILAVQYLHVTHTHVMGELCILG